MTKEEGLDWLYRLKSEIYVYMPKEWIISMNNALDMAIKELEQEPCDKCVYSTKDGCCQYDDITEAIPPFEPCEDAISRQAAKKILEDRFMELQKRHDDKRYETNYCLNTILELPSVNPQEPFMNKPCVAHQVCHEDKIKVLNKIRAEIAEYGSIWVVYKITGIKDKDIERLVNDVLKQAKEQVLDVIDKYIAESEDKE